MVECVCVCVGGGGGGDVSKCSSKLYVFTIIPPRLTDQCNFITVL